jgi:ATP/maltotriose-dependent transcriptional regulator MalT
MFAAHSIGFSLTAAGRYAEAANVQPTAREQARALKARRYEAVILSHCAEVALAKGQRREALALIREGLEISEQTGPGFAGPILYGLLALLHDRAEDQEAALEAGETLLEKGSVGHNHFWFRRYAIERALLLGNWNEADRHADALLRRMTDEPLPYATYVAERGQLLARRGRGDVMPTDDEKLAKLLTSTNEIGMRIEALGEALRQN